MEKAYAAWRAFQDRLLAPVAASILLGCTLLALLEVFRRYLFGVSYEWQQDAVTYFLLSAVFLYFGIAQRQGKHLTVDILVHVLEAGGVRAQRIAEFIRVGATLLAFAFMLGVCWWGTEEVLEVQRDAPRTESLEFALAPFLWVLLAGFAFMAISLFFQSWRGIQKLRGREVLVEPPDPYDLGDRVDYVALIAIVVFVLLLLAVPIGIALSGGALAYTLIDPLLEPNVIFRAFFNFISKYTLMSIPLFIFAGFLMERTGLVALLFRFADALVGWLPGGFGIATILACVLFAAISGSSVAMAAAMSVIAIPEMLKRGYPPWVAGGLVATSGGIAILIPPSIPLILYGIVTETSVVDLFFAGVIPGLLLALANVVAIVWLAYRLKLQRGVFDASAIWPATLAALPAFGMPVVILGGLYGGLFTPTEAAAAACGYALVYGLITRRAAFLRDLLPVLYRSLNLTAVILFLVGCVGVFQFLAANLYWPQTITKMVASWGLSPTGFIFAFILLEMILGCFVDGVAMILLTIPVVYPVAHALKIDLIHLGIMMTLTVEMSLVTPPVGLNLFAVSGVSKIPVSEVVKGAIPFFITDAFVLLAVVFFPGLATWLPSVMVKSAFGS